MMELATKVLSQVVNVIIIISPLLPLGVQLFKLIGQRRRNQTLINLSTRADTIVKSLEMTNLLGPEKKKIGLNKLLLYAREVGINLTENQAADYIDGAVFELKKLNEKEELPSAKIYD